MKIFFTFILFAFGLSVFIYPQEDSVSRFNELKKRAKEADSNRDYKILTEVLKEFRKFSFNNPSIIYYQGVAEVKQGSFKKAISYLNELVEMGAVKSMNLNENINFEVLRKMPEFKSLVFKAGKKFVPQGRSKTAFILKDRDLIPEGIAWDPKTRKLFVSSMYRRKIVSIDPSGQQKDFVEEKDNGLLQAVGMEVDSVRRHLWVCSGYWGTMKILDFEKTVDLTSKIFKYDIDSGKLIKVFYPADKKRRFFNDLTIGKNGDIYCTETMGGYVFRISGENGRMEQFPAGKRFCYPNGITLTADNRSLIVADYRGAHLVNIETGKIQRILHPHNMSLTGIDGLSFYKGSLVAHQWRNFGGLIKYYLNEDYTIITRSEILETLNPFFDFPTTGVVAGKRYFYIPNGQVMSYDKSGKLLIDKLKIPRILVLDLD